MIFSSLLSDKLEINQYFRMSYIGTINPVVLQMGMFDARIVHKESKKRSSIL